MTKKITYTPCMKHRKTDTAGTYRPPVPFCSQKQFQISAMRYISVKKGFWFSFLWTIQRFLYHICATTLSKLSSTENAEDDLCKIICSSRTGSTILTNGPAIRIRFQKLWIWNSAADLMVTKQTGKKRLKLRAQRDSSSNLLQFVLCAVSFVLECSLFKQGSPG
jgi:hypothetical protein